MPQADASSIALDSGSDRKVPLYGHALSVVALPMYGLGRAAQRRAPPAWRHVLRSDHYYMHRRSPAEDWPRLTTSLTNCFIGALVVLVLVEWLRALGYRRHVIPFGRHCREYLSFVLGRPRGGR